MSRTTTKADTTPQNVRALVYNIEAGANIPCECFLNADGTIAVVFPEGTPKDYYTVQIYYQLGAVE